MRNTPCCGDNLDVLHENIADSSVDLVYLDLLFNSICSYNILIEETEWHGQRRLSYGMMKYEIFSYPFNKEDKSMPKETIQIERPAQNITAGAGIKTSYADSSQIVINPSDVHLYFGIQPYIEGEDTSFEQRIVLTHSAFMRMMEYWAPRYTVLQRIYDGQPMSLNDFDQAMVQQAFDDTFNPPDQTPEPAEKAK